MTEHPDYSGDPRERVPEWTACPSCRVASDSGAHVAIEPFDATSHTASLWHSFGGEAINERIHWFGWPWLEWESDLARMLEGFATREGWSTAAFMLEDQAVGMASFMREDAANGVVETGAIALSDAIARTPAATEGHYLMMRHAFGLGYRRYEWKCDAANEASRRAALRLGFTFESVFRQHQVKHGRNRDTAWFSIIDGEWPRVDTALRRWLDPTNFDPDGRQRRRLADLRDEVAV